MYICIGYISIISAKSFKIMYPIIDTFSKNQNIRSPSPRNLNTKYIKAIKKAKPNKSPNIYIPPYNKNYFIITYYFSHIFILTHFTTFLKYLVYFFEFCSFFTIIPIEVSTIPPKSTTIIIYGTYF